MTIESITNNFSIKYVSSTSSHSNSTNTVGASKDSNSYSQSYDMKNMTRTEMSVLSHSLYEQGKIDLDVHASLSFDDTRLGVGTSMQSSSDYNGKYDWIKEFTERVNFSEQNNDPASMRQNQKILEILSSL